MTDQLKTLPTVEPHPSPADRWRNRRRMAWISMIAAVAYPVLTLAVPDGTALSQIAGPFYIFVGMVVAVYIGAATWDDQSKGGGN